MANIWYFQKYLGFLEYISKHVFPRNRRASLDVQLQTTAGALLMKKLIFDPDPTQKSKLKKQWKIQLKKNYKKLKKKESQPK